MVQGRHQNQSQKMEMKKMVSKGNKAVISGGLLFLALISTVYWKNFYGVDWEWVYPFYTPKTKGFSEDGDLFVVEFGLHVRAIIYIVARGVSPRMILLKMDLWALYLSFELCLLADWMLYYNQYAFRDYIGAYIIGLQFIYIVKENLTKEK